MKVLYTGHYREFGGWSNAAKGLILALDSVGIDVVCRNITLTRDQEVDEDIKRLENKNTDNVDYCIQNVLPHHLVGSTKFKKNIAYCLLESTNIKENLWMTNLNQMDEVWVPCEDNKKELIESGISNSHIVPLAFNMSQYKSDIEVEKINFNNYGARTSYKFYTIANINKRKNIEAIIRAYYNAFYPHEDVVLVIKANKSGLDKVSVFKHISEMCYSVRESMGIYQQNNYYNNIVVIADNFEEEEIASLHKQCDCFINLSHGEAWSIPAFEAMCYGNHPICTGWGGPREYIKTNDKNTGWLINYCWQTCSNKDAAFSHLFRGKEFWACPDEKEASKAMRYYYENRNSEKNNDNILPEDKFSFQAVGEKIKELLQS